MILSVASDHVMSGQLIRKVFNVHINTTHNQHGVTSSDMSIWHLPPLLPSCNISSCIDFTRVYYALGDFRFWAQFIRKSVNHRVMQFHFTPNLSLVCDFTANYKNEEVAVTVSVAEAVLCFSARVCKQQRELERICKGLPKKKPNTAVIGPARSLGTQWDCQRDQQLLHSGIMQCLSIHPLIGQICNLAEQCGVTTYRYSKVSFLNYNVGCMEGENNTSCTAEWNWELFFDFFLIFFIFYHACGHITTASLRLAV